MTVLFDNDGLKIWIDGFSPIIFVKFNAMPSGKMDARSLIKKSRNAIQNILSKVNNMYSVIDLSECGGKCSETLLQYCFTCFPELLQEEVKYLAFVNCTSHKFAIGMQVQKLSHEKPHLRCESFSDFFVALNTINTIRQEQIALPA